MQTIIFSVFYSGVLCENEVADDNPCNRNPCEGGGSCIALAEGGFICKCPDDRDGELCEKGMPLIFKFRFSNKFTDSL